MDTSLAKWLCDALRSPNLPGAEELRESVEALTEGKVSALMLELGTESEAPTQRCDVCCGQLVISPRSRKVTRDGQEVSLTPKEFDILYFLARNRGEIFTKEQIYRAVWAEDYLLDDSNIMAFIRKLRKKIEPDPDAP